MAKKKSNFLYYLFIIISIIVAGIAIASITLPAFNTTISQEIPIVGTQTLVISATLLPFLFGQGGELTGTINDGDPMSSPITGGMSYLALAGFIALCLGTLLLIILLFKKSKLLALLAALLLIGGGICIFFFREFGTNVSVNIFELIPLEDIEFKEFFKMIGGENVKLGLGTIVFGAGGCLAGLTTLIAAIAKK